jgi:maltose/moltooligosaccharide transporter
MNAHPAFEQAVSFTGLLNAGYNIVTFIVALLLMRILSKFSAHKVHAVSLLFAAFGLLNFSVTQEQTTQIINIVGLGIAWASIMGVPFSMVVPELPKEKYGVYMGIINMMIVIPMIIQTLTFGWLYQNILQNNPSYAICFAACLFFIAATLSFFLFNKRATQH